MSEDKSVDLFNPHNGLTGRDGGPYLDEEERRLAEVRRAAIEDREPDLKSPPASAGTPLVTAGELAAMANPASIPSQQQVSANADPLVPGVKSLAEDDDNMLEVFSQRVDVASVDTEQAKRDAHPATNPASPVYVSKDPDDVDKNTHEQPGLEEYDDEDAALDALTTPDDDAKK